MSSILTSNGSSPMLPSSPPLRGLHPESLRSTGMRSGDTSMPPMEPAQVASEDHTGSAAPAAEGEDESEEEDDDGLYPEEATHATSGDEEEDGGFGDEEQVEIASSQPRWTIDHSKGDYKLYVLDFIRRVNDKGFTGDQAIEMLQTAYTMNYGIGRAGARRATADDKYLPEFFLDMLAFVGQPLRAITKHNDQLFDNVTVTFKNWQAPYSTKHLYGVPFQLEHRTFRIATAATREKWYIVMHPIVAQATELPSSRQERNKQLEKSSRSSAMQIHHARQLATYITQVFQDGSLLGVGVEPSWRVGRKAEANMEFNKWTRFQELFMRAWPSFAEKHSYDEFWTGSQPAFHAYDYGANQNIEVTENMKQVPREMRGREGGDEDENESDVEGGGGSGDEDPLFVSSHPDMPQPTQARRFGEAASSAANSEDIDYEGLYAGRLLAVRAELEGKYRLDSISTISYALAANINCLDGRWSEQGDKPSLCLLGNRNLVDQQYRRRRDYQFHPLGYHPALGNWSSEGPPEFLENRAAVMRENMSYQNGGTDPLRFGHFQGYNNLKRSIRHDPKVFLATKGIATGGLALPSVEADASASSVRHKRQQLLRCLQGDLTPEDPDTSRPFAREERQLRIAIDEEAYAFRMEQVVSISVMRLAQDRRTFSTVLNPLFQLIRFFLKESSSYSNVLHAFTPEVFPGVLCAFGRLFSLALGEILQRSKACGPKGLGVALSEGVAALDRLGSYCFTGFPTSLMGSVMGPLGTIGSIEAGAWPYINPRLLDLRKGLENLSIGKWPCRGQDKRPILMHVAALKFHYGPRVAASRESNVWFRELAGMFIRGPNSTNQFLVDLFRDLWIPQMVSFLSFQFQRHLSKEDNLVGAEGVEERQMLVEQWSQSDTPFAWEVYQPVYEQFITKRAHNPVTQARRDFSRELYEGCSSSGTTTTKVFSSVHATWIELLRAAIQYTPTSAVGQEHWIGAISAAMLSNKIECVPGSYRSKLSSRRLIRLVGSAPSMAVLSARPGTLKYAAVKAEERARRSLKPLAIDFGYAVPFQTIPEIIMRGFTKLDDIFASGDGAIREHYGVALQCLEGCLGDPICDVLLMLVLTLSASTITPTVLPYTTKFDVVTNNTKKKKNKDSALFAANLVTRMLWFYKPECFPWAQDQNGVLRVSEMTKKVEHKGVNNRLLRELGWVKAKNKNLKRDSPRNSDVMLADREELCRMQKDLRKLRKNAVQFIRYVFRSRDEVWVERCGSIIQERSLVASPE